MANKFFTPENAVTFYIALFTLSVPLMIAGIAHINDLGDGIESLELQQKLQNETDKKQDEATEKNAENLIKLNQQLWQNNENMDERVDELERQDFLQNGLSNEMS